MYHRSEKDQIASIPQVGQVVIIKDERMPRCMWKLCRIERLITGTDGGICTTDIYLPGNRHMQCSINMLYPLEIYDEQADKSLGDNITSQDAGHSENGSVKSVKPPTRQAAITARHKIN